MVLTSACATQTGEIAMAAHIDTPEAWYMEANNIVVTENGWLSEIDDAQLTALVREALENNRDLTKAQGRLNRARASLWQSEAAQLPSLRADSSNQVSEGFDGGEDTSSYGLTLAASWELDVWNRLSHATAASQLSVRSSEADYQSVRLLIAANTAQAYFQLIEAHRLAEVERSNLASLEETLGFVSIQFERGLRSSEDIALIRADVETARASLDQAEQAKRNASRAIEVLVGRYPATEMTFAGPVPHRPVTSFVGQPAALLEQRPDIQSAKFLFLAE
ncbi:MAG: TolC family protein, partial [Pseudomonadota bacterium]